MGAKFTCVFDENLFYRFYTDSGETSYDNFSSGEKMRLAIATSFAFRDFMSMNSGINANILILDEYLDSNLDATAIANLMNILKEFSIINKYDIYIVSHRKDIADTFFNNIITVEKTNEVSTIRKELVNRSKE
jgi:DNA repair exonuclease SbcCD ATPase subunit